MKAEEAARAAHNRPSRQSRLERTLEESDAVMARQLQADEERLLLGLLVAAQDPVTGTARGREPPAAAPHNFQVLCLTSNNP